MSKFRSIFRENWGIKLAAVALSVLVLFHVKTEGDGDIVFSVPVELEGIPDSLTWTGETPGSMSVTLSGKLKNLIKLRLASLRISIDLSEAGPGRFQRTLSAGDVPVPEGSDVAVSHFAGPDRVDILIEKKVSRAVPVVPLLSGEPAEGFYIAERPTAQPEAVSVTGPASRMSAVDSVYTNAIDVSGRKQSFSLKVRLDTMDGVLSCDSDIVEVFVLVANERPEPSRE
jgi:YbbR domain-containing protein